MNMPRFTGEASLYQASGHYRTGRYAITLPTPMISGIYPARDEVIEVHSCAPGWTDYGGTCFPDPLTEPSSGSGTPNGGPGGGGEGGVPGPGGTPTPHKTPTGPKKRFNPKEGQPCHALLSKRCGGVTIIDEQPLVGSGKYVKHPEKEGKWQCDDPDRTQVANCGYTSFDAEGCVLEPLCYNGHSA